MNDRLFVPLSASPFEWFLSGHKTWELRRRQRQFTPRHVWTGRRVELRRGYSDPNQSLWGEITGVETADSLSALFDAVNFGSIIPTAKTRQDAERIASDILGLGDPDDRAGLIAFRVDLPAEQRELPLKASAR